MYELMDETAAQVLLATETGDSIRAIAGRIQRPYETVRQAVDRLEDAGFVDYDDGLVVTDDHVREAARELLAASARVSAPTISEAYVLPQFFDRPYAFSRIDAVYLWTQGGYQVARAPDDYPLFIAVDETDLSAWESFFASFDIPTALERQPPESVSGSLQVVLDPRSELDVDIVEGRPVVPRTETIEYMYEHYAHFQSGLSMLDRMYDDLDLDEAYRERERAQA
jgi:DNA-binding Lrp family transcriptional regulator